jgi:hydrogenase maturation protein HypF
MGNVETLQALQRSVRHFLKLFRVDVQAVVADQHPGYLSGQWAREFADTRGLPLLRVQHHFAHVVSLLAEHGWPVDQPIIGCCFDGTGYGTDGAIWGGEFLMATASRFRRVAHLAYWPLPGGEAAIRFPWRTALALLWSAGVAWDEALPCVSACPEPRRGLLRQQLEKNLNCVPTSSMGRMFDAVASLLGIRHEVTYEAQAAMEMEALAARVIEQVDRAAYRFHVFPASARGEPARAVDSQSLWQAICRDVLGGTSPSLIAARFHHAVASLVVEVCQATRQESLVNDVGLTGGVYQNALLLRLTRQRLAEEGFNVLTHKRVPPNDGGLALGQAVATRLSLAEQDPSAAGGRDPAA